MRFIRFARDLKDLQGTYRDLAAEAAQADDDASYKLTLMARGFARRSRRVVDDKLSFSATLMRAGEVDGANRLLEEVQTEVRTEEAALMEKVNEAKVAQAVRKDKMTRLRLVRMVVVAVAGSMLMGFSAFGYAAVSYFDARERDAVRDARGSLKVASAEHELQATKLAKRLAGTKDKRVAAILMKLSMSDLLALEKMTSNDVDVFALEKFLVAALPTPALAQELTDTIAGVAAGTPIAASPVVDNAAADAAGLVDATRKHVKEEAEEKDTAAGDGGGNDSSQPSDEPSSQDDPPEDDNNPPPPEDPQSKLPPNLNGQSSDKDGDSGLLD
jgi:hypothetical protein